MEKNNKEIYNVIILGSGPAGLEASIYTAGANFKTLVLGKKENSRLFKAHLISNYLGFREGISGKELLENGIFQANRAGATIKQEEAIDIKKNKENFLVKTDKDKYLGKSILLATGVKNNSSGIFHEEKYIGQGISFCVACDGSYFTGKNVGVLGEGEFATEEALELKKFAKNITIYSNGEKFLMNNDSKKKLESENIKFNKEKIKEFFGEGKLEGISTKNGGKINLDGMFIAKGSPKASDFAYKLNLQIFNNYIVCDDKGRTNISGVFAAGDVIGSNLQVSFAVGSGANAAFSIMEFLNKRKEK